MKFVIRNAAVVPPIPEPFWWTLDMADGTRICRSSRHFSYEREARQDITSFRKSIKGAKFAKVTVE